MPEKRGAGGSGRRGLPPYCDEGVPGLGLPLISEGSYDTVEGGGRDQSTDARGVEGLRGEDRVFVVGRGIEGVLPRLELGREPYAVEAVGLWYRSGDVLGFLYEALGSACDLFFRVTRALRVGDLPAKQSVSLVRVRFSSASARRYEIGLDGCWPRSAAGRCVAWSSHLTRVTLGTGLRFRECSPLIIGLVVPWEEDTYEDLKSSEVFGRSRICDELAFRLPKISSSVGVPMYDGGPSL